MENPIALPLDAAGIQQLLPHRYPFLLVDRVLEIVPDKHILAYKNITQNEPFFTGHFPGKPIMPGVLIIEALAQAGGVLTQLSLGRDAQSKLFYLVKVDNVRFMKQVVPGDVLELHVKALRGGGRVWRFEGRAMVDGELAAEATYTAMFDVPKG